VGFWVGCTTGPGVGVGFEVVGFSVVGIEVGFWVGFNPGLGVGFKVVGQRKPTLSLQQVHAISGQSIRITLLTQEEIEPDKSFPEMSMKVGDATSRKD
jgi:hypothetical protein